MVQKKKKKKKRKKAETGGFELTFCLSRIERSMIPLSQKKMYQVVITSCLREGNFHKLWLVEFGCDARSFARDRKGYARSRGIAWRPGAARVEKTYFNPIKLKMPMMDDVDDDDDASVLPNNKDTGTRTTILRVAFKRSSSQQPNTGEREN